MSDSLIVKPEDLIDCAAVAAQIRHAIHQYPEIGLNLTRTEQTIVEALKSFGCEDIHTRVGGLDVAGVVCVVKGEYPGRTIEPTATPCLSMKTRGHLMRVNAPNICMPAVTMVTSQLFWPL